MVVNIIRPMLWFVVASLILLVLQRSAVLVFLLDFNRYSPLQMLDLYYMGLRFDLKVISALSLIFYLLPLSFVLLFVRQSSKTIVLFSYVLLLIFLLELLICLSGYGFYHFFGSGIDQLIFGLTDDGFVNVIKSMAVNSLAINLTLAFLCFSVILLYWMVKKHQISALNTIPRRKTMLNFLLWFVVLSLFARGSFGTFPLSRKTNQANADAALNALALNSIMNLYYAYRDNQKDTHFFSSSQLLNDNHVNNFDELKQKAGYNKHNPLIRKTSNKHLPPPNIVFVLMEGWSSHIASKQKSDNNVLGAFNQHKNQDYFFTNFFSNSYGTNPTIERLLQNSPITPLSQSKGKRTPFDISNMQVFKKAGYTTNFISGGNRAWRSVGDFQSRQGFDNFFDRSSIEQSLQRQSNNPWGAFDGDLFEFSKQKMQNSSVPFFNFLLTTNNHPPVVLPAEYQSPDFDLSQFDAHNKNTKTMLDGYYYQTNELGKFISWLKSSEFAKNTIVVATGDHVLKGFANYNLAELGYYKYAVPLYLYIPESYKPPINTQIYGSHLDIFPTLFDLSLSEIDYFSFGKSLLKKDQQQSYGWNANAGYHVIFPKGVANKFGLQTWGEGSLLSKKSIELNSHQRNIIQQLHYQEAVAKYLIFKDFERQNKF
ncbi:hypothetical protein MS2017_1296 [Bathymodiolus thermophilus thioautotrophic gill symbiont]|uniref:Sulfatase N-terminal domain-containing protein n=1 Tax=Bathymodiolus thermophilus thioautotrophic gill symbiont TaxID=2360 RepID=A0A3G3IMI0_9GAMM|nr:alkaline phosphatase family protein [Bathymodiolus thermophilus thioautotrophic gill symbiont]AYQ56991.1 hypothetical protein MS2017_1296 [Bathymodiolus thermophilus thioautotrophic gill symbiont]